MGRGVACLVAGGREDLCRCELLLEGFCTTESECVGLMMAWVDRLLWWENNSGCLSHVGLV